MANRARHTRRPAFGGTPGPPLGDRHPVEDVGLQVVAMSAGA
jgi:hypothetical protein